MSTDKETHRSIHNFAVVKLYSSSFLYLSNHIKLTVLIKPPVPNERIFPRLNLKGERSKANTIIINYRPMTNVYALMNINKLNISNSSTYMIDEQFLYKHNAYVSIHNN